jgi:hypothetical protein
VVAALVQRGTGVYNAPPWLADKTTNAVLRWRVIALYQNGAQSGASPWRSLRVIKK